MKRLLPVILFCAAFLAPAWGAERSDPRSDCAGRLKALGQMCLLYAEDNKGQMPPSLAELYYRAYVNDLKAFVCPGKPAEILGRDEINAKSGYVLAQGAAGAGARPVVQDRSPENHGDAGINVFYSDGSVRWQPAGGKEPEPPGKGGEPAPPAEPEIKVPLGQNVYLGIRVRGLAAGDALLKNLPLTAGVLVEEIQSGGAAAGWGLQAGDILVKFGEKSLLQPGDLTQAVAAAQPQSSVAILIFRAGKPDLKMAAVANLPALIASAKPAAPPKPEEPPPPLGVTIVAGSLVSEATLCLGLDSKGEPIQPGTHFPATVPKIACRIAYKNAPANTDIVVAWFRGDSLRARSLGVVEGTGRIISYVYTARGEAFQTGRYRVEISVRGKQEATAYFLVE